MSLRHAILVLLEKEPGSGYDLVQRFKSGIGHFWSATHQQVYQELKKLGEERLVTYKVEEQEERPDRKVYRITRAGQRTLREWQCSPVNPPRINNALLVKVFGLKTADLPEMLQQLDRHLDLHRRRLTEYLEIEKSYFAGTEEQRREFREPYLTLRLGILYEGDWIAWLAETTRLLARDELPKVSALEALTPGRLAPLVDSPAPRKPAARGRKAPKPA